MKLTRRLLYRTFTTLGTIVCLPALGLAGQPADDLSPPADLTSLKLEDLMNVEITSVSKQRQRVGDVAAAVTVIGQEDIQRSGLNTIPDLLRLVPGADVARVDASRWAISVRGFNDEFSNKLLVLMDGRSVYTSSFGGVFWGQQDYILQDLDRIEVVRGPGATIWGSNAVNGVINILSKSAKETQGLLLYGRGGTEDAVGAVRYGGQIDENTYYRVYGQYRWFDEGGSHADLPPDDSWQSAQTGFRLDRYATPDDTLTLQGDLSRQWVNQTGTTDSAGGPPPNHEYATADGGNVLGRWTHASAPDSGLTLQVYYDRLDHYEPLAGVQQDTIDIDFQHRFRLAPRQEVTWGLGYRYVYQQLLSGPDFVTTPESRSLQTANAYLQDDIALVPERLHLIAGTKLEYNSFTDLEVQPGARLLWTPNERNTLWASYAHAVRTPARYQEDSTYIKRFTANGLPGVAFLSPNTGLSSETLDAFEAGYRFQPSRRVSLDASVFYNAYDNLIGTRVLAPGFVPTPAPHIAVPSLTANNLTGESYGGEVVATWNVTDSWKLVGSYSLLELQVHRHNGASPDTEHSFEDSSPEHQVQARSYLDVTSTLQFNALAYYVSPLSGLGVPGYVRVDLNLAWRPKDNLEVAVGVQNLFDDRHPEFSDMLLQTAATESQRNYYVSVSYRY